MSPESRQRLEKYREKYEHLLSTGSLSMNAGQAEEILSIVRKEIDPNYKIMLWCPSCVEQMLKFVFNHLQTK